MVNHPALDRTFTALADPIRRSVLASLRRGERSVSDLAPRLPQAPPRARAGGAPVGAEDRPGAALPASGGAARPGHGLAGRLSDILGGVGRVAGALLSKDPRRGGGTP